MVLSANLLSSTTEIYTRIWNFFSETVPQAFDFLFSTFRAFFSFAGALPSWLSLLIIAISLVIGIRIVINVL